jgi:DHA1 family multidrug resistance protein-like MFS transporter
MILAWARLRSSWVWLLILFTFSSFIETIFFGQLGAFTPLYLPRIGVRPEEVTLWTGIIASVSGILGLPFLPFWGALADRYARKPVIVRSFVVHLLTTLACAAAGNVWIFLLGRTISSLALGNSGLMLTTLAERAPSNRQGLAFSIMSSAGPIGVFIGPLVGGPIVDHQGLPTLLLIDGCLFLIVVLGLTFGYRDDFKGTDRGSLLRMALDSIKIILRSDRLKALFPALFLLFAGWMMALTYVPVAVSKLYQGQDQGTMVGLVLGAGGFVALFVGPLVGLLADRFGHWRVLLIGSGLAVFLWPLPGLVVGLLAFVAAWAAINGLTSGVFSISFNVLSSSTSSEVRGRVMSFAYLPVNVGIILGPSIGSLVTRSSVFAVFPTAAVLTAFGVGLLVIAKNRASSAT